MQHYAAKSVNFFLVDAMGALIADVALFGFLIVSSISDLRTRRVPNALIVAMILCWMLIAGAGIKMGSYSFATVSSRFFGALMLGGLVLLITCLFERITQSFAMGGGDIKLIFASACYLGIDSCSIALLIACLIMMIVGGIGHLRTSSVKVIPKATAVSALPMTVGYPFAPAFMLGAAAAVLFSYM